MALFHIETQGCRANLADSVALAGRLRAAGLGLAPAVGAADLVVVNTCTVTGCADADARQLVERLRRQNPGARLVVTGCLAEAEPATVAGWRGVDEVLGNRAKPRLLPMLGLAPLADVRAEPGAGTVPGVEPDPAEGTLWDAPTAYPMFRELGHTRAFVKVQDGCDASCSFCIIPRTRGASRSLGLAEVVASVRRLGDDGAHEVVLTGIHLGHWGRERGERLVELLAALERLPRPERIRLTSIEPNEVDDELVARVAGSGRFAPHFHLPLQSGSDAVLGRMRRPYTASRYSRAVERVARRLPGAGIGADVIAGFPGESEADAAATESLVSTLPLTYLHVFRWSPRRDTDAARLPGRVAAEVAQRRARRLRGIGRQLSERHAGSRQGCIERALTLASGGAGTEALTGSFVHVRLPERWAPNQMISVRMGGIEAGRAIASAVDARGNPT